MLQSIPTILQWINLFKRDKPLPGGKVSVRGSNGVDVEEGFCLSAIADIEESVWAPKYGLKGMIDASVEATFLAAPEKVRLLHSPLALPLTTLCKVRP
jgi:hypothetical protein